MAKLTACFLLTLFLGLINLGKVAAQAEAPTSTPDEPAAGTPAPSATPLAEAAITEPRAGQVLQGVVTIRGSASLPGFVSAELEFGYADNPLNTWFLIQDLPEPVTQGVLAQWDTTTITDGNFTLRLRVYLADGSVVTNSITGLRVRNYSPVETDTPTPVTPTASQVPGDTPIPSTTPTPSATPEPSATATPTKLPDNPAILTDQDLAVSLGQGALAITGFFALLGLYQSLKKLSRRR